MCCGYDSVAVHVRALLRSLMILFGCLMLAATSTAAQVSSFGDARIEVWAHDYLDGKADAVLKSVRQDLLSSTPHPYSSFVWAAIHSNRGDLELAIEGLKENKRLAAALGVLPKLQLQSDQEHYREMINDHPVASLEENADEFVAYLLGSAAENCGEINLAVDYYMASAVKHPASFILTWQIYGIVFNSKDGFRRVNHAVSAGGVLADSPIGKFIEPLLALREASSLDEIAAVKLWLKQYPQDSWAMRFLSASYLSNKDYVLAVKPRVEAMEKFPFATSFANLARVYASVEQFGKAREVVTKHLLAAKGSDGFSKAAVERYLAEGIRFSGWKGKAREILDAALKQWPDDAGLHEQYALLELNTNKREVYAISHSARAIDLEPDTPVYFENHISALNKGGKARKATQMCQDRLSEGNYFTQDIFGRCLQAMQAAKKFQVKQSFIAHALEQYPHSRWLLAEEAYLYAGLGDKAKAVELAAKIFRNHPNYDWSLNNAIKQASPEKGKALIKEFVELYPWKKAIYDYRVKQETGEKTIIWQQAGEKNPERFWPVKQLTELLLKADKYKEAIAMVLEWQKQHPKAPQVAKANAWLQLSELYRRLFKSHHLNEAEQKAFEHAVARLDQSGFSRASVYYSQGWVAYAAGDYQQAARLMIKAQYADPDWTTPLAIILQTAELGSEAKGIGMGYHRYLERDPYDGKRLIEVANRHARWIGGSIIALELLKLVQQRSPDYFQQWLWTEAISALGAYDEGMATYLHRTWVGNSERYIKWFEGARKRAQHESSLVRLGGIGEPHTVTVRKPDGSITVRRENAMSGKLELIRRNGSFIKIHYDETGDKLQSIESSNGRSIKLEYDDKDRITSMKRADGQVLTFEYNAQNKPVVIAITGVGEINVDYDAQGKIASINSDQGHQMALKVTSAFQELLSLVNYVKRGEVPFSTLQVEDKELETLKDAYLASEDQSESMRYGIDLATYLVAHIQDNGNYEAQSRDLIRELFSVIAQEDDIQISKAATLVELLHTLYRQIRPEGLDRDDFLEWGSYLRWLADHAGNPSVSSNVGMVLSRISRDPLRLLPEARWLVRSDLTNPGYWRSYKRSMMLPKALRNSRLQGIYTLSDKRVALATDHGISIFSHGFWKWYGVDSRTVSLADNPQAFELGASSNTHAITQTSDGAVWLGTSDGLIRFPDIDKAGERWITQADGLASPGVIKLISVDDNVVVLTEQGISKFNKHGGRILAPEQVVPTHLIDAVLISNNQTEGDLTELVLAVASAKGLYRLDKSGWHKQSDEVYDELIRDGDMLTLRRGKQLFYLSLGGSWKAPAPLPDQHEIIMQSGIRAMSIIPVGREGEHGLGIMTDQGLAIYRDVHFEHTKLDFGLTDRIPDMHAAASRGETLFLMSDREVMVFERGHVQQITGGAVTRIENDRERGVTYFLREGVLHAVTIESGVADDTEMGTYNSTDIALEADGSLIVNDGLQILRYHGTTANEIFSATPSGEATDSDKLSDPAVKDILVASDGAIWVATNLAVFRWKDGNLDEYNWFVDSDSFPAPSDMIYRIMETVDNKIWAIASYEGHRMYNGVSLNGGLVEFNGHTFVKKDVGVSFLTSYTKIDANTAIAGSNGGFYRYKNGTIQSYKSSMKDVSYLKMLDNMGEGVYLGTNGANLGKDTWLFGSANGLIAYHRGLWFYPDRLNRLLPEDSRFASKGGRAIHAVATDADGRVFVGTDRGMLIYDSGDDGGIGFLLSNGSGQLAFQAYEQQKLQKQADSYFAGLNPGSKATEDYTRYRKLTAEVEQMRNEHDSDAEKTGMDTKKLKQQLKRKQRAVRRLLAAVQTRNPGLYQMLEMKPFDLQALRNHLEDGQLVVQLIPTSEKLVIHLVSRDGFSVREVSGINRDTLFAASVRLRSLLENQAQATATKGVEPLQKPIAKRQRDAAKKELNGHLAWLYNAIILPVEDDIRHASKVFFVGVGSLNYVPFAALTKNVNGKPVHAVEYFANTSFGYLPSLYMFQMSMNAKMSGLGDHSLVVGNPTGDLQGAEAEANAIAGMLGDEVELLIGKQADVQHVSEEMDDATTIHISAHGILNSENPYASYLKLANGDRLDLYAVMELPLHHTDLVVLSACNSGRGVSGQEYATLAWSFAHAGVSTIVASLWEVPDVATRDLMETFYAELLKGSDTLESLASAQRSLIKQYPNNPAAWAGFVPFGRD